MADDSDADDDDSFTVTQIAVTGASNSAVAGSSTYNSNLTTIVTGTYGTLEVGANGTYTYVADQDAADDLDAEILLLIVLLTQFQMVMLRTLLH